MGSKGSIPTKGEIEFFIQRHTRIVRITHWVNALCVVFMIPSGIAILIAHPEFYWGETGYFGAPFAFKLPIEPNFLHTWWGRGMHFLFAWILVVNGVIYLSYIVLSRKQRRKLIPRRDELRWNNIASEIGDHIRLRPPSAIGDHYNVLQKISYIIVVLLLSPLIFFTGLTMSPAITSVFPELLDLFGGRQSARTIHFIAAALLVLFILIHVLEVFVVGFKKEIWAMISGQWKQEGKFDDSDAGGG